MDLILTNRPSHKPSNAGGFTIRRANIQSKISSTKGGIYDEFSGIVKATYWRHYQVLNESRHLIRKPGFQYRPTKERIEQYDLLSFLKPRTALLDVGCNEALFGVCLDSFLASYTGVDTDNVVLQRAKQHLASRRLTNWRLINEAFLDADLSIYNVVLCLACHCYLGDMSAVGAKLAAVTEANGVLILESHNRGYAGEPARWLNPLQNSLGQYFRLIKTKEIRDRCYLRDLFIYKRIGY